MMNNVFTKYKYYFIAILFLLIVGISFGYSKLMATLEIDGDVNVSPVKWNIEFVNLSITEDSFTNNNSNIVKIDPEKPNRILFNVTLDKPGDFYEFTVNIKNSGSLNAKFDSVIETGTTNEVLINTPYIDYSINGLPSEDSILSVNSSKEIKVRIEYLSGLGGTSSFNVEKGIELKYVEN